MRFLPGLATVLALTCLFAARSEAQTLKVGETLFKSHCAACHDPAINRAPNRAVLRSLPPAAIIEALTNGIMKPMGAGLSPAQKQSIAAYLTGLPGKDADQSKYPIGGVGVDVKCKAPN